MLLFFVYTWDNQNPCGTNNWKGKHRVNEHRKHVIRPNRCNWRWMQWVRSIYTSPPYVLKACKETISPVKLWMNSRSATYEHLTRQLQRATRDVYRVVPALYVIAITLLITLFIHQSSATRDDNMMWWSISAFPWPRNSWNSKLLLSI